MNARAKGNKRDQSDPGSGCSPEDLLKALQLRFEAHPERHSGLQWSKIEARLRDQPAKLQSLAEMESTGGEPDVVGQDATTGEYLFFDCSLETPKGRTSVCYDREGLESRKEHKPADSAVDIAVRIGIELLDEEDYRKLQDLGKFDNKTSSWLKTPEDVRKLGGALFGDLRFGRVFVYHNGAQSYYSVRGFRGCLRV